MKPKYAVFGGEILSANDGDRHYIPAVSVARLYGLASGMWIHGKPDIDYSAMGVTVLRPCSDGNYTLPAGGPDAQR